jgi:hypothetical protein
MFSQFVDTIFDNSTVKKLPVINILVWSVIFLKPVLKAVAEILDFLVCTENRDCGIKLI